MGTVGAAVDSDGTKYGDLAADVDGFEGDPPLVLGSLMLDSEVDGSWPLGFGSSAVAVADLLARWAVPARWWPASLFFGFFF